MDQLAVREDRCWLLAGVPARQTDFRIALNSRHSQFDVRFCTYYVRFAPRSRHSSDRTRLPVLTQIGHFRLCDSASGRMLVIAILEISIRANYLR